MVKYQSSSKYGGIESKSAEMCGAPSITVAAGGRLCEKDFSPIKKRYSKRVTKLAAIGLRGDQGSNVPHANNTDLSSN